MRKLLWVFLIVSWTSFAAEPIQPLPKTIKTNPIKVKLGEQLFHDKNLSADATVSCASCHNLATGGVDCRKVSVGINGRLGTINSPTVFNSFHNFKQFWDGRADDLQQQAMGPVTNPDEMGATWPQVIRYLQQDPKYQKQFKRAYPKHGITKTTISNAIAEFEKTLSTPSRFDDYLRGDKRAITAEEKRGYALFKSYGCATCHHGVNVGGQMFMKMGLVKDYFKDRGNVKPADYGRYNVTKREADKHVFKVPGLRNVALTAPYLHDASTHSLVKVIQIMGKYQLGKTIPAKDAEAITAFLRSLTGKKLEQQGHGCPPQQQ